MYSQGLPCTGRDSILVRLAPMAANSISAATSDPGRCSTENARLILFASGSLSGIRRAPHQKEPREVFPGLSNIQGSGIIYTLTVRDAVQVAGWLQARGIQAEAYTGETGERRVELEDALLENRVKALVATTALGMGFDKPNLAFVIHYQTPGSVVAYYQQVGRAGRALAAAHGVLLSGEEETDINDYFIESAFPSRDEVASVLAALQAASGRTVHQRTDDAGECDPGTH